MIPNLPDSQKVKSIHAIARAALAFVFVYHGLVPKLVFHHADEIAMLRDAGINDQQTGLVLLLFGIAELLLALCLVLFWRHRWPSLLCIGLMCIGTIGVVLSSPRYLVAAFNPISLNLAIACLAVIDVIAIGCGKNETNAK